MQRSVLFLSLLLSTTSHAEVAIDLATVNYPGNLGAGYHRAGYGAVDYIYGIGRYEVTTGQYTEFLNAVATTDTYGLYNTDMFDRDWWGGCKIERDGLPGSYSYSIAADRVNRPVNYVSWSDAVRFTNWLHNGQPTGEQDFSTTEDGSYLLDGAMSQDELTAIVRKPDATYVIPTEDEWYKAAYYNPHVDRYSELPFSARGGLNSGIPIDTGTSASWSGGGYDSPPGGDYFTMPVGYYSLSTSHFETFDQAANVHEWTETTYEMYGEGTTRIDRGGMWGSLSIDISSDGRGFGAKPTHEASWRGFRVASTDIFLDLYPGDANLDRRVDVADFNAWNASKFINGTYWQQGDFTANRRTDVADFNVWNANKFTDAPQLVPLGVISVPEPASIVLLASGLLGLLLVLWRRYKLYLANIKPV